MAVPVVDALEVVDVDHQHGTGLAVAAAVVEQGGAALQERPPVEQPAERVAGGQLAQLAFQRLVGADVKAPQQVRQLPFHLDQAGRQRTPAGVLFANHRFHGIDLAVAVQGLGEAFAGFGVVQQLGQKQGLGRGLEPQAFGELAVDEVHAAAFDLGQHHVAGAGVQDEAQQRAAFFDLAGAAGHPHFELAVGLHQLLRCGAGQAGVAHQLGNQQGRAQQQPAQHGTEHQKALGQLLARLVGLLGAEEVDVGDHFAQAVQQGVGLPHDVGGDGRSLAVAVLGGEGGQLGGPALHQRAQAVQVLGGFGQCLAQLGADTGPPARGVERAEQHFQPLLQVLCAGLAGPHLARQQAHPGQLVVHAGHVPQVVLLVGLRQHMGLAQRPPQGGGRGQRHGRHHGQQPVGGVRAGLAGGDVVGRPAGQRFTGG